MGTAGLAREMATLARQIDPSGARWRLAGYVGPEQAECADAPWLGPDETLDAVTEPTDVVVGIGRPAIRAGVVERLRRNQALSFPTLIHPTAVMDDRARIVMGEGNAVCAGVVLTCDIAIGDFNLLNLQATIGHDVRIGDYNVVNPGANISGYVTIESTVLVGTGSQILETVRVGCGATVGAGAVVTKDIAAGTTVAGVPARLLHS